MAISKVLPQKSHLKCAVRSKRRPISLPLPCLYAPDSSLTSTSPLPSFKQSEKSWRQHCQQHQQNKEESEKNQEHIQHQKNQLNSIDSSSCSNLCTSARLGLISGGGNSLIDILNKQQLNCGTNKQKEREELFKLNACYKVIKSMKLANNFNYSKPTRRLNKLSNYKYLSKLAIVALSLVALSSIFLTASRANVLLPSNGHHSLQEFDLNKHREILDRIAQESFRNNINQQHHQEFSKHNQLNLLDKPQVDNQLVPETQHQHHSNLPAMVQQQQQQNHQLEDGGGNRQFMRLLSNQPAPAASNSEPVWTSSEPMLGEHSPFVSDSSNSGTENNKNFNPEQPAASNNALPGLAADHNHNHNHQHQHQQQQPHQHLHGQYISYRPLVGLRPTTPSMNRQLLAPPPFYELGLTPINAVQVEHDVHGAQEMTSSVDNNGKETMIGAASSQVARQNGARSLHHHLSQQQQQQQQQHLLNQPVDQNMILLNPTARSNMFQQNNFEQQQNNFGVSSSSTNNRETAQTQNSDNDHNQPKNANEESGNTNNINNNNVNNNGVSSGETTSKSSSESSNNSNSNELQPVDKAIEPRQKRRIFNRILKKAEWNHLFVELSKVFLRYFLDLALKDIIGKQSGADTTTSRKKLDAQSELTDLLKDFVKTAISNI